MTENELCNLVLEAAGKTEAELPRFRILGLVREGLELFSKRVASQQGHEGLKRDFIDTPANGRLDLNAIPDMLFDANLVEVRDSFTNRGITMIDSIKTLEFGGLPADQVFCARDGDELVFKAEGGDINTYSAQVRIKANQIVTLQTLKAQYNGAVAAVIAELATGKTAATELTGASV